MWSGCRSSRSLRSARRSACSSLPLPPPGSAVVQFDLSDLLYAVLFDRRVVERYKEIFREVLKEQTEGTESWLIAEEAAALLGVSLRTFERRVEEHPDLLRPRTGPRGKREWSRTQLRELQEREKRK